MIDNLDTLKDMHHDTLDYVERLSVYEKHCFTKASNRCYEKGQILKENETKDLDRCLKNNEFIMKLVNDLKLHVVCGDGLPFPNLNNLDQLKEEYAKRLTNIIKWNKLEKVSIEYFVTSPAKKCLKIQNTLQSIQDILKESSEQKEGCVADAKYL